MMGGGSNTITGNTFADSGVGGSNSNYMGPTTSNSGSAAGAVGGGDLIPGPIGTGGTNTSYAYGTGWEEFCDRHARVAAADFAKACISYINGNLTPEEARNISHRSFSQKFGDAFLEHFDTEFNRRRSNLKTTNGTLDESEFNEDHDSHKLFHKAFFRRLSFKGLRKGKALFHKNSDESKTKLAKIVVECRKEGIVNNLIPESIDQPTGTPKWEKCRLALVKAVGGYMLEFYTPPKSTKPRSGVFCFLISEARETSLLEMPDRENTFVLKADNNMEYVIEAQDANDMRSWLATIRYCMRTPPTQQPTALDSDIIGSAMQTSPVTLNSPSGNLMNSSGAVNAVQNPQYHQQTVTGSNGNIVPSNTTASETINASSAAGAPLNPNGGDPNSSETATANIPDIPPRRPAVPGERGAQRLSASSNFDGEDIGEADINVADLTAEMRLYPWFHGTLPRSEAARMVLHSEAAGHGYFLVRQSETRKGEFVLTFNFQGRAKHLRMTLSDKGQCRVQHLWFPSIQNMLEHFRDHAIPLESGGSSDVTLTEFVHNQGMPYNSDGGTYGDGSDLNDGQIQQQQPSPRHPQEVITMNLSVRLKTCEIELPLTTAVLAVHQQQQQHQHLPNSVPNAAGMQHHPTVTVHSNQAAVNVISHDQQQQQQLRASTVSLQSHQQQHHHNLMHHHSGIDANANAAAGAVGGITQHEATTTPRAVDNQYSFV